MHEKKIIKIYYLVIILLNLCNHPLLGVKGRVNKKTPSRDCGLVVTPEEFLPALRSHDRPPLVSVDRFPILLGPWPKNSSEKAGCSLDLRETLNQAVSNIADIENIVASTSLFGMKKDSKMSDFHKLNSIGVFLEQLSGIKIDGKEENMWDIRKKIEINFENLKIFFENFLKNYYATNNPHGCSWDVSQVCCCNAKYFFIENLKNSNKNIDFLMKNIFGIIISFEEEKLMFSKKDKVNKSHLKEDYFVDFMSGYLSESSSRIQAVLEDMDFYLMGSCFQSPSSPSPLESITTPLPMNGPSKSLTPPEGSS